MQQPRHRFCEVPHIEIGVFSELGQFLSGLPALAGSHQDRRDFHGCKSLQISYIITDSNAVIPIDLKILRCPLEQSGERLAATAATALRRYPNARVMGAVVKAVDARAQRMQPGVNLVLHREQITVVEQTARDAGLIRNDNQLSPRSM